jgi:hypothetical protein
MARRCSPLHQKLYDYLRNALACVQVGMLLSLILAVLVSSGFWTNVAAVYWPYGEVMMMILRCAGGSHRKQVKALLILNHGVKVPTRNAPFLCQGFLIRHDHFLCPWRLDPAGASWGRVSCYVSSCESRF